MYPKKALIIDDLNNEITARDMKENRNSPITLLKRNLSYSFFSFSRKKISFMS